jgi:hypothetical protein
MKADLFYNYLSLIINIVSAKLWRKIVKNSIDGSWLSENMTISIRKIEKNILSRLKLQEND